MHDNLNRRRTVVGHCRKGYVVGTEFEHYRPWKMWMKDKRLIIILPTIFHKHNYITNPGVTLEDCVMTTSVNLAFDLIGRMANHLSDFIVH